jgi:molecular chaperone DnaK (HSP70)
MPADHDSPNLASALARSARREVERQLERARYYAGIDLGTTNSSVTIVDALALLEGDTEEAVRVLPVPQLGRYGVIPSPFLPSIVAEVAPDEWRVGQGAREARSRGLLRGRQIFYSTKSEMGLGRDPFYPQAASPDLDSPYKVAGQILSELKEVIEVEAGEAALESVVVTVPASFQLAARKDTFRAAALAGLEISERALLDEPNAAILDYLLTCRPRSDDGWRFDLSRPRNVLVFDFGGGTCDVSVLRVQADDDVQRLRISNLSIARYERLGGDNIDAAIVEQVLLPQLLKQNEIESLDLSFAEKKERILPQLLSTAEALKLRACGLTTDVPRSLQVDLPARVNGPLSTVTLRRPEMTPEQFDHVLEPFLDTDFLFPRDTELTPTRSIFGPIEDALQRAGLDWSQVDGLLPVGGSALIPQVEQALESHLSGAALLRFPEPERALFAVTRGAALHSFFLHALGRPLLNPIAQESLGILTSEGGFVELVPSGTELPYPPNGESAHYSGLVVPRDLMKDVQIVVAAEGPEKPLGVEHLRVPDVQSAGEPIDLAFRLDANKLLTVEAALVNHPDASCEVRLENPLCSVAYTSDRQKEIAELEGQVGHTARKNGNPAGLSDRLERLGALYSEESQYERAIDQARKAMAADGRPSASALDLIARCYARLGDNDRAEKHYREAIRVAPGASAPRFNLSLLLERQGRTEDALDFAEGAFRAEKGEGVYRGWRAILWRRSGRDAEGQDELVHAAEMLDAFPTHDPWQRFWRERFAEELGETPPVPRPAPDEAPPPRTGPSYDESLLPGQAAVLARRAS